MKLADNKHNEVNALMGKREQLEKENARLKSIIESNSDLSGKLRLVESLRAVEDDLKTTQSIGKIASWEFFAETKTFVGSDEAFQIFGIEPPETKAISTQNIKKRIHNEDLEQLTSIFSQFLQENERIKADFRIYVENPSGFRETKYIKLSAKSVMEFGSEKKSYIGIIQDITDIKKQERDLIRAKEKAEESDKLKSAFLANMSHELRTPMNAIIGFSELLNIEDINSDKRKEYAHIIKSKGTMLMNLIDDIIEVSKFEAGNINIHKSETNLTYLLQELYTQNVQKKNQLGKDALNLKLKLPEQEVNMIYTDPGRLQQVLSNLLSNALKFTDKGEVVFGYKTLDGNKLEFFIKDTGIGISKEKQKVIFNRFRQVEDTDSRPYAGGAGLGLTLSKGIVELLGGKIWVESEPKKETVFYFTLPYEEVKNATEDLHDLETRLDLSRFNWKNKVILIAEDEEVNYKFLETVLHDTHAQVLHAKNGKQVIDLCKSIYKIDLILMDIKMPVLNGYEATREVKKLNPSIPVIAQTAFSMKEDYDKCFEAGCDDYISKPIDIKTLMEKINRLLSQK